CPVVQQYIRLMYRPSLTLWFSHYPAPSEVYTLSLHDALPIYDRPSAHPGRRLARLATAAAQAAPSARPLLLPAERLPSLARGLRSEEHTSELQSRENLVCRLLLEKKKKIASTHITMYTSTPIT